MQKYGKFWLEELPRLRILCPLFWVLTVFAVFMEHE